MRLRRGWEPPAEGVTVQEADPQAEEMEEAAANQPVNRLLLVVHGIGQNLTGSNIAGETAGHHTQCVQLCHPGNLDEKNIQD